jgi:hypothetical protein
MAAAGVPMRTIQEWMGPPRLQDHPIYADNAPGEREVDPRQRGVGKVHRSGYVPNRVPN